MMRGRVPNVFFKRAITYLLHRYLGEYLDAFHPEDVFLTYNKGTCVLQKVAFKVEALNSLCSEHNVPLEFIKGTIETVIVEIPWSSPLVEDSIVEFKGTHLVVQPTKYTDDGSMLSSMWESAASSMQMAEECLLQKINSDAELSKELGSSKENTAQNTAQNVKLMAAALDMILSKLKVKFTDTFIRVESMLNNSNTGIALEVKIKSTLLFDEAGINAEFTKTENSSDQFSSAYCVKKLILEGIELYSAQFTSSTCPITQTQLVPGSPEMPPPHPSLPLPKTENADLQTEPILISRINGQQQIRLKLKQNDSIVGPKVDVEINLGLISFFLTPFQIHTLLELMRGIAAGGSDGKKHSTECPTTATNRPMKPEDFRIILEQALQKQNEKNNVPSKSLQNCHGWSSHSLDESEDVFHLLSGEPKTTSEGQTVTEDFESSCSGSSVGSERLSYTRTNLQNLLTDSAMELTHIYACCSSLLVIVLHEDVVSNSANPEGLLQHGYRTSRNFSFFKNRAESFFNDMSALTMEGVNMKDFASVREKISHLCQSSHLRFLASGVTFECSEKTSSLQRVLNTCLTALDFEALECLFNASVNENVFEPPSYMEIISFHLKESNTDTDSKSNHSIVPCIKMKWDRFESIGVQQRTSKLPPNKLSVTLAPVYFEVDMSLSDRIHSLFHPEFLISRKPSTDPDSSVFLLLKHGDKFLLESQRTEVNFSSNFVVVNLRFPVPDRRPLHDMDRVPWWKQNLRKESFLIELEDASLFFVLQSDQSHQKYEIQCRDFHGLFQMSENGPRVSCMRVSVDPEVEKATQDKKFDWPRLVMNMCFPQKTMSLHNTHFFPDVDYSNVSITDTLISNIGSEPSPFCSNITFCGSKMKFSDDISENCENKPDSGCDDDEIVMPADKEKMDEFIDHVVNNSRLLFDFFLPTVNVNVPDKEFFDLMCNRMNDMITWQPTPLSSFYTHETNGCNTIVAVHDLNPFRENDDFQVYYNSEASSIDSDSDSDEESGIFYSLNESNVKRRRKQKGFSDNGALTDVAFLMTIEKGSLTIQAPVKGDDCNFIPDYCGKMHLFLKNSKFLSAAGYRGEKNQTYMCMMSNEVSLYHNGLVPISTEHPVVQPYSQRVSENLNKIIYGSEFKVPSAYLVGCRPESMSMLSVAVHMVNDLKQQLQTFKIAVGFSGTTCRHYMAPLPQLFSNQLTDFLNVTQQPISGLPPLAMVMEFHLHLLDCAVDYRPLYLPLRTVLTVEHFSLSTNISKSATTLLRTISEDLHLFISNDLTQKSVDLKKNYVCVVDTGFIDVSVRMTDIEGQDKKKFEMCVSNNMIHVRTCSDSCQALQKLIIYVAGCGDFAVKENAKKNGDTIKTANDVSSKNVENEVPATRKVTDSVQDMMVEAMKDFSHQQSLDANGETSSDYSDEDFYILEDDPGIGLLRKNCDPQIRVLTHDPIRIVENHFSIPSGKSDLLKAPKHFPEALCSHTLREMSITWHLYGGSDFAQPKSPEKKHVKIKDVKVSDSNHKSRFAEDQSNVEIDAEMNKIAFCKVTPLTREFDVNAVQFSMENIAEKKSASDVRSWIVKGGENRDHNVLMELQMNKVKFQHEVYPDDSEYVSRHVLLIHDIEIRDKLTSSMINKFLYQYSCESMPRQTHANMVVVKAVHIRPDPKLPGQECSLKVSCKPLRLHIDQDALMFLFDFFKEFAQDTSSAPSTPSPSHDVEFTVQGNVDTNFKLPPSPTASRNKTNSKLTYFKSFSFSPEVLIRLDYHGKRVIMDQGALQGILMGLTQLNCSEIVLKRLSYRHGLLGSERLLSYAANEWLQDIKSNQLPSILGGIGPMHSFVQLFQGLKDLIWMPVVQYRRDGQIVRGLQRGASSFSTSTLSACLEITSRIVGAIQGAAEVAYDMVSPGPSVSNRVQSNYVGTRRTNQQPADVREGMTTAYNVVKEGFGDTVRTIARVASVEHEHKGICGAVGGVMRQLPPATVKPIILGAEAVTIMLGGVKHQLVPDAHKEAMDKWRTKNN